MPALQTITRRVKRAGQPAEIITEQVVTGTIEEAVVQQAANVATEAATVAELSDLAQSVATAAQWLDAIQTDAAGGTAQANTDIGTATAGESVAVGNVAAAQTQIRALYTLSKRANQRQVKIIEACDRMATITRRLAKIVARNMAQAPMP